MSTQTATLARHNESLDMPMLAIAPVSYTHLRAHET